MGMEVSSYQLYGLFSWRVFVTWLNSLSKIEHHSWITQIRLSKRKEWTEQLQLHYLQLSPFYGDWSQAKMNHRYQTHYPNSDFASLITELPDTLTSPKFNAAQFTQPFKLAKLSYEVYSDERFSCAPSMLSIPGCNTSVKLLVASMRRVRLLDPPRPEEDKPSSDSALSFSIRIQWCHLVHSRHRGMYLC